MVVALLSITTTVMAPPPELRNFTAVLSGGE
jgi:hypothetical protein